MKKAWDIVISEELPIEVQKIIRKILRPSSHPGISHYPQKCLFCEEETTWTINDKPVCPKCAVEYKFLSELWLLDPCEVCGKQGEWATDNRSPTQHFLCHRHTDAWFHWDRQELKLLGSKQEPGEWQKAWDESWGRFVTFMKEKVSV